MKGTFVFIFGLVFGSFLNVCISRLPHGKSLIWPKSRCAQCGLPISWFDLIPILSYCMLGGRCRRCHGAVSKRYPFVELVSGLLWLLNWNIYGASFRFIVAVVFLSLLLIAVFTDFETALIPDSVTFFGMFMGLAMSFLIPPLDFPFFKWSSFGESFFGLFVGGSLIFGSGVIGKRVFKKETIGGGDIKLLAMIGSFLGWRKVLLTFFMAPFLALPFAFLYRWIKKQETIPYGSFLSLAAAVQFFYGETIWVYFIES